jgi:hypothetical protein
MFLDKAPYIITIILAGLAWTVTHLADRLLGTPLLTYESRILRNGNDQTSDGVIIEGTVIPIQPAWEGDTPPIVAGRTFDYTFPEIQPGSQFEVPVTFRGSGELTPRISAEGIVDVRQPSWETFVVEYEILILIAIIAIGVLIFLICAVVAGRRSTGETYDT